MMIHGEPGTTFYMNGQKYVIVISRHFICDRCNIFCKEAVPVFSRKLHSAMKARGQLAPQAKIFCSNGCSERPDWSVRQFDWNSLKDRNRVREWPDKRGWSGKGKGKVGR